MLWNSLLESLFCLFSTTPDRNDVHLQDCSLQLLAGVELLETVKRLLSVHAGGDAFAILDPLVLEYLVGGETLARVDGQHAIDQVLGVARHAVPLGRRVVVAARLDLLVKLLLVLVPERRVADEQDVENDAASPHVHRLSVRLSSEHLRSEVARRACEAIPRVAVIARLDCQAEVGQLHVRVARLAGQQQVLRL